MEEYACAILIDRGRVLMGLRAPHRKTYPGSWDVIGGKIEHGEDAETALTRELDEEIGVMPITADYLESLADIHLGVTPAPLYHFFIVSRWKGEPSLCNHEHTQLRWFSPNELAQEHNMRLPEYHGIIERAQAA